MAKDNIQIKRELIGIVLNRIREKNNNPLIDISAEMVNLSGWTRKKCNEIIGDLVACHKIENKEGILSLPKRKK